MNTVTVLERNDGQKEKNKIGFIALVCKKIYDLIPIPSIFNSRRSGDVPAEDLPIEVDREGQFSAYVHNRMNVLMIWIQHRSTSKNLPEAKQHLYYFLHDMEHHFVDSHAEKRIRDAFRWIRRYLKLYPAVFEKDRTQRAYEMVGRIYEGVGLEFIAPQPVRNFTSASEQIHNTDEPSEFEEKLVPSVRDQIDAFFQRNLEDLGVSPDTLPGSPVPLPGECFKDPMVKDEVCGFIRRKFDILMPSLDKSLEGTAPNLLAQSNCQIGETFLACVPDRITVLLWTLQWTREMSEKKIYGLELFLEELEQFTGSYVGKTSSENFRYLKSFLKRYPHVTIRQRQKAIEKTLKIYESLGFHVVEDHKYSLLRRNSFICEKKPSVAWKVYACLKSAFGAMALKNHEKENTENYQLAA